LLDEIISLGNSHHESLSVDICRCYHFGPKFLVEMEVILPADMLLRETHDIGMSLQYKLENVPEVERAFVHIDYSAREYDEHVMSRKVKSYQHQMSMTSPQGDDKVRRSGGGGEGRTRGESSRPLGAYPTLCCEPSNLFYDTLISHSSIAL
jgi:hypothetical protein